MRPLPDALLRLCANGGLRLTVHALSAFRSPREQEFIKSGKWDTLVGRFSCMDEMLSMGRFYYRVQTVAELAADMEKGITPMAQALELDQVLQHPQVVHSQIIRSVQHAELGKYSVAKPAAQFLGTPSLRELSAAPLLGEHNTQILRDL